MSRIGKLSISLKTAKAVLENGQVSVTGPLGVINVKVPHGFDVKISDNEIVVTKKTKSVSNALWGMLRSLLNNAVLGVETGFERKLEMIGVGFRASVSGAELVINAGYSHQIHFPVPEGIKITVEENTKIIVKGSDKILVGQTAANIKKVRLPEPYKGKGIKYQDETIRRKASKSQKAGAAA